VLWNANNQDDDSYCVQHKSTHDNGGGKWKRMENFMELEAGNMG
jgi:hypothetical protein